MELITAIALICQLHVSQEITYFHETIKEQKSCQKKLATCILKETQTHNSNFGSALKCIKDR